jgi:RNA polymerase sigma factor (TIGR02999 family)
MLECGDLKTRFFSKNMAEMPGAPKQMDITQLLLEWGGGDAAALDQLMPVVYAELRKIARRFMRRQRPNNTLQTTDLVNEAYLRLIDSSRVNWQSRTHFFAVSAQLMRRILVDAARRRNSQKRGGGQVRVTLDESLEIAEAQGTDVVALDEALRRLAELNPRHSQIVELRYFGGLTEEQVAELMEISPRTVRRDWSLAKAWLFRELSKVV